MRSVEEEETVAEVIIGGGRMSKNVTEVRVRSVER